MNNSSQIPVDEEVKDHFYEKLQVIVEKTPKHDLLVITGDLNAKVGSDAAGYERVMGKHGVKPGTAMARNKVISAS